MDSVAASMTGHPRDQVLVQAMAEQIVLSGVLMTFDLSTVRLTTASNTKTKPAGPIW